MTRKTTLMALAGLGLVAFAVAAFGQAYPINTPAYAPNPVLPQVSVASTATLPSVQVFQLNAVNAFTVRVQGTFTGLVAEVDVSNDRSNNIVTSPTWTAVGCIQIGAAAGNGQIVSSITVAGIYRCNVSGMTQARFNVTALSTGTVTFGAAGTSNTAFDHIPSNYDLGSAIPITAAAPLNVGTTTNSADFINSDGKGAWCSFSQVSSTGSPSAIITIQVKDAASLNYFNVLSTAAITSVGVSNLEIYPGFLSTDVPTGQTNNGTTVNWVARNFHLPKTWRVQAVVTGAGDFNASLGCNVLQ